MDFMREVSLSRQEKKKVKAYTAQEKLFSEEDKKAYEDSYKAGFTKIQEAKNKDEQFVPLQARTKLLENVLHKPVEYDFAHLENVQLPVRDEKNEEVRESRRNRYYRLPSNTRKYLESYAAIYNGVDKEQVEDFREYASTRFWAGIPLVGTHFYKKNRKKLIKNAIKKQKMDIVDFQMPIMEMRATFSAAYKSCEKKGVGDISNSLETAILLPQEKRETDPLTVAGIPENIMPAYSLVRKLRDMPAHHKSEETILQMIDNYHALKGVLNLEASPFAPYLATRNRRILAKQPEAAHALLFACVTKALAAHEDRQGAEYLSHAQFGYLCGLADTAQMAAGLVSVHEGFRKKYVREEAENARMRTKIARERWDDIVAEKPQLKDYFFIIMKEMGADFADLPADDFKQKMEEYAVKAAEMNQYLEEYLNINKEKTLGMDIYAAKLREQMIRKVGFSLFSDKAEMAEKLARLRETRNNMTDKKEQSLLVRDAAQLQYRLAIRVAFPRPEAEKKVVSAEQRGRRDYLYEKLSLHDDEELMFQVLNDPTITSMIDYGVSEAEFQKYVDRLQVQYERNRRAIARSIDRLPALLQGNVRAQIYAKLGANLVLGRTERVLEEAGATTEPFLQIDKTGKQVMKPQDKKRQDALNKAMDVLRERLKQIDPEDTINPNEAELLIERFAAYYEKHEKSDPIDNVIKYGEEMEEELVDKLQGFLRNYRIRLKDFKESALQTLGSFEKNKAKLKETDYVFDTVYMMRLQSIFRKYYMMMNPLSPEGNETAEREYFKETVSSAVATDALMQELTIHSLNTTWKNARKFSMLDLNLFVYEARSEASDNSKKLVKEEAEQKPEEIEEQILAKIVRTDAKTFFSNHKAMFRRGLAYALQNKLFVEKYPFMQEINGLDELDNLTDVNREYFIEGLANSLGNLSPQVRGISIEDNALNTVDGIRLFSEVMSSRIEKNTVYSAFEQYEISQRDHHIFDDSRVGMSIAKQPLGKEDVITANYMQSEISHEQVAKRQGRYAKAAKVWSVLEKQKMEGITLAEMMRTVLRSLAGTGELDAPDSAEKLMEFLLSYTPDIKKDEKEKKVRDSYQKKLEEVFREKEESLKKQRTEYKNRDAKLSAQQAETEKLAKKYEGVDLDQQNQQLQNKQKDISEKEQHITAVTLERKRLQDEIATLKQEQSAISVKEIERKKKLASDSKLTSDTYAAIYQKLSELKANVLSEQEMQDTLDQIFACEAHIDGTAKSLERGDLTEEELKVLNDRMAEVTQEVGKLYDKKAAGERAAKRYLEEGPGLVRELGKLKAKAGLAEWDDAAANEEFKSRAEKAEAEATKLQKNKVQLEELFQEKSKRLAGMDDPAKLTRDLDALKKETANEEKQFSKLQKEVSAFLERKEAERAQRDEITAKLDEIEKAFKELPAEKQAYFQQNLADECEREVARVLRVKRPELESAMGETAAIALSAFFKEHLEEFGGKQLLSYANELMMGRDGDYIFGSQSQNASLFLGKDERAYAAAVRKKGAEGLAVEQQLLSRLGKLEGEKKEKALRYGKKVYYQLEAPVSAEAKQRNLARTGFETFDKFLDEFTSYVTSPMNEEKERKREENYEEIAAQIKEAGLGRFLPYLEREQGFWDSVESWMQYEWFEEVKGKLGKLADFMNKEEGGVNSESGEHLSVYRIISNLFLQKKGDTLLQSDPDALVSEYKTFRESYYSNKHGEKKSIAKRLDDLMKNKLKSGDTMFIAVFQEILANGYEDLSFLETDEAFRAVVKKYEERIKANESILKDRFAFYQTYMGGKGIANLDMVGDVSEEKVVELTKVSAIYNAYFDAKLDDKTKNARYSTFLQHIGKQVALMEPEQFKEAVDGEVVRALEQQLQMERNIEKSLAEQLQEKPKEVISSVVRRKRQGAKVIEKQDRYLKDMQALISREISPLAYAVGGADVKVSAKDMQKFKTKVKQALADKGIPFDADTQFLTNLLAEYATTERGDAMLRDHATSYDPDRVVAKMKEIYASIKKTSRITKSNQQEGEYQAKRMMMYVLAKRPDVGNVDDKALKELMGEYKKKKAALDQFSAENESETDAQVKEMRTRIAEQLNYALFTGSRLEEKFMNVLEAKKLYLLHAKQLNAAVDNAKTFIVGLEDGKHSYLNNPSVLADIKAGVREYYAKEMYDPSFVVDALSVRSLLRTRECASLIAYNEVRTSVGSADYAFKNAIEGDMSPEKFQLFLEKNVKKADYRQYMGMTDDMQKAVLIALLMPQDYYTGERIESRSLMAEHAKQKGDKLGQQVRTMKAILTGRDVEFTPYYTAVYDRLRKDNGGIPAKAFSEAMKFTQAMSKAVDHSYTGKKWDALGDASGAIEAVMNDAKLTVNGKAKQKAIQEMRENTKQLKNAGSFVEMLTQSVKGEGLKKLAGKLEKLTDTNAKRLVVILQNRTILDYSTAPGKEETYVNPLMRKEMAKHLLGYQGNAFTAKYTGSGNCILAMQNLYGYQLRDERDLGNREFRVEDISAQALKRKTAIDAQLLERALDFLEELDKITKSMLETETFDGAYAEVQSKKEKADKLYAGYQIPKQYMEMEEQFGTGTLDDYAFEGGFLKEKVSIGKDGTCSFRNETFINYERYMQDWKNVLLTRQIRQAMRGQEIEEDFTDEEKHVQANSDIVKEYRAIKFNNVFQ